MNLPAEAVSRDEAHYASAIESILLVASEPVTTRALTKLLEIDSRMLDQAIDYLVADEAGRGIRVQLHQGRVQLVTAPENAEIVRRFLQLPRQPKISRPAMESMAIIAYRQPVTRGEIEQIRGVNVDRIIANLEAKGWIEEAGRRESPGRPIEYATTSGFLEIFGLTSIDELPVPESEKDVPRPELTVLGLEEDRGQQSGDIAQESAEAPETDPE